MITILVVKLALDQMNTAIEGDDPESLMTSLTTEYAGIDGIDENVSVTRYHERLRQARTDKGEVGVRTSLIVCLIIGMVFFSLYREKKL